MSPLQPDECAAMARRAGAYTDLATCPLPPPENRLPVAIEAGEKIPAERR